MYWEGHVYLSVKLDVGTQQFHLPRSKPVSCLSYIRLFFSFTANCLLPKLLECELNRKAKFLSHSISIHFPLKCLSAPAHLFGLLKYWKQHSSFQQMALKTNMQCILSLEESMVCYVRAKTRFTLKVNIHSGDWNTSASPI